MLKIKTIKWRHPQDIISFFIMATTVVILIKIIFF
jgi:hypothetical protein